MEDDILYKEDKEQIDAGINKYMDSKFGTISVFEALKNSCKKSRQNFKTLLKIWFEHCWEKRRKIKRKIKNKCIMSNIIGDCWLSPYGDVHVCVDHEEGGNTILDDLGLNELFNKSRFFPLVDCFLESLGYVKYSTHQEHPDWCITSNTRLTQAQIDKIYELTGEVFENENLIGPCCLRSYFFIQKNLNDCGESLRFRGLLRNFEHDIRYPQ